MKRVLTACAVLVTSVVGFAAPAAASPAADLAGLADIPDIEWPPADVKPPQHSAETLRELAAAMGEHLATAFPSVVPEATDLSWAQWGGEWEGHIVDGQDYLTTWAIYTDEVGQTGTAFQIEAPGHFTPSPRDNCAEADVVSCTAETLPDGSLVLHRVSEYQGDDGPRRVEGAYHYRTDGSLVWISAYDYDPIWDGDEGPARKEIALSTAQLTALATDPALQL